MNLDNMQVKGTIKIMKYFQGKLVDVYEFENLITNAGRLHLLQLIGGDNTMPINKIALGSGNNPAQNTDIALNNKIFLADVQKDYSIAGRINFLARVPENTFSGIVNYKEAGLVHKSANSEILISRVVFNDIVYQKPENSLSFLYSLELKVG